MGRDRAVLRWGAHTSLLRLELDRIEREIARLDPAAEVTRYKPLARLEDDRAHVLSRLRALGPSPLAKMG